MVDINSMEGRSTLATMGLILVLALLLIFGLSHMLTATVLTTVVAVLYAYRAQGWVKSAHYI